MIMTTGQTRRSKPPVTLPPGLPVSAIAKVIEYVERKVAEVADLCWDRPNICTALVRQLARNALDANSVYEKSRHLDLAQQRFPDLKRRGCGSAPSPQESLECKASKRPWAVQSHYDHPGWYIIWRVDVAFFDKADWVYETSRAGAAGGGRTHTFGIKNPAQKLKDKAVYRRSDVRVSGGKAVPRNGP